MPFLIAVFAVFLLSLSSHCSAQPSTVSVPVEDDRDVGEVVVDLDLKPAEQVVEIKDVFVRKPNRQVLLVKNTTKSLLRPKEVSVSCGCVTARMEENGVRPGDFLKIELDVNLTTDVDKLIQTLSIVFEESEISRKDFVLKAAVQSDVVIQPRTFRFNGSEEVQTITLKIDPASHRLKSVTAESGNILIDSVTEASAGVFELKVRSGVASGQATELLRAKLTSESDSSEVIRDFVIGLAGASRCTFLPSTLDLTDLADGTETRVLLIFPGAYTPQEDAEFSVSLSRIDGESTPLSADNYRISRRALRVFEIYLKDLTEVAVGCDSVKVCCEKNCFFLPLTRVE